MVTNKTDQKFAVMPPPVSYVTHPAFQSYHRDIDIANDEFIEKLIQDIDKLYYNIQDESFLSIDALKLTVNNNLYPKIDLLGKILLRQSEDERSNFWMRESIKIVKDVLCDNLILSFKKRQYKPDPRGNIYASQIKNLMTNGYAIFEFPAILRQELTDSCEPFLLELRNKIQIRPGVRAAKSIPLKGRFGKALKKIVNNYGILIAASEYRKHKMELLYAALELSTSSHNWYKGCYEDVGMGTTRTVTMHYDYESSMMKAMIYLTPVDEMTGATGIVVGSHNWRRSPFLFAFLNELDLQYPNAYPDRHNEESYYRPRFKYRDERKRFINLPQILQATSHFGDDIIDGSQLSEFLLSNEVLFISDKPECLLFDGPQAIHRGGMVIKGERIALQLAFRVAEEINIIQRIWRDFKQLTNRLTSFAKRRLRII